MDFYKFSEILQIFQDFLELFLRNGELRVYARTLVIDGLY